MKVVDTGFLIDLLLGDESAVRKARELDERGWAATTAINVYELVFSLYRVLESKDWLPAVENLLMRLDVLPFDSRAAIEAGKIFRLRAHAQFLGLISKEMKGFESLGGLVAAIVKVNGCESLVTRNTERYSRFKDLNIESY